MKARTGESKGRPNEKWPLGYPGQGGLPGPPGAFGALGHGGSDLLRSGDGDALELSQLPAPSLPAFLFGTDHGKDFVHFLYKLRQHNQKATPKTVPITA